MAKKVAKLNPKEDQITKEILRQFCPKIKKSKIIDNTDMLASTSKKESVFVNKTESVGEPPLIDSEVLGSNDLPKFGGWVGAFSPRPTLLRQPWQV